MNPLAYLALDKDVRQLRRSDIDALAAQIRGGVASIDTSTQLFPTT